MTTPSKTTEIEFGRYAEGLIPETFFERATRELSNYFVSFSVDDRSSGSATLVAVDKEYGFLTAAHVVDDWLGSPARYIAVVCAPHLHQLLLDKQHIDVIRYGPSKNPFVGPDLAFVGVRDIKCLSALKSKKSFYPLLNSYRAEVFEKIEPRACTICFVSGAPAEMSRGEGVRNTASHILQSTHFFGRAQVSDEFCSNGFDYLKLDMIAGHSGFPSDYRGMSGGGIWHVPFGIDPNVGIDSLVIERPELVGVAFAQSDFVNKSRTIYAHGYKSLYNAIRKR